MQKIKNIHWVDRKKNTSQLDKQTDEKTNGTDFVGPFQ